MCFGKELKLQIRGARNGKSYIVVSWGEARKDGL